MGSFGKWLFGLIVLALVALALSLFGPWNAKDRSANMGASVQSALKSAGFSDVTTTMSGNVAKLSGTVSSDSRKADAIATAENAQCEKCNDREAGKRWHDVDGSALTVKKVVPTVSPYSLSGVRGANGGIVLSGYAHSAAEKAKILEAAEVAFPGQVTDRTIQIAIGGPSAGWADVARANIGGLAQLDSGEFSMTDMNSVLTGRTTSTGTRSAINASISGLPEGFNGATNIVVPDAAADNTGEIRSEKICQRLFEQLKGDNKINFAYNSDRITGVPSIALLDTMASAASQCSSFRISVEGHTDTDGSDAYNLDLSQRRAQAVVDHLIGKGVAPSNISARGYGETSPIASNDTREGKARNRRIEFKVTRSN